jgi:hypothetical protein
VTVVLPEGTPTLGNTKVMAVVDIASMVAPSLAGEINDVTSVDASCYLYPAGWTPTGDTPKGQKPARLCSKVVGESLNRTNYTIGALQYVHDPQTADAATGNELRELLQEGTKIFFVERMGLDAQDVAFAAGQRVLVHHLELGPQIESGDRTDENGEFFIQQAAVYVSGAGPVVGIIAA